MVKNVIDINISSKELDERKKRCEMQRNFEKPDRVPVVPLIDIWYWLPRIGRTYREFFSGAPQTYISMLLKTPCLPEGFWILLPIR
ncbi:MAG TPA: hypothetical protein ENI15_06570 [Spirochaetes bacterium]|nr:hypothetical protein [Spirochaetota bacterium]